MEIRNILYLLILYLTSSNAQVPKDCVNTRVDLFFLIETTPNIGSRNVGLIRTYLSDVVNRLRVSPTRTRISVTSYGSGIANFGTLKELESRELAIDAISQLRITGRGTNVAQAMNHLIDEGFFTEEHGRREDIPAICFLMIGTFTPGVNVTQTAINLRRHCRVVVIGGTGADRTEVRAIASQPSNRQSLINRRYSDLARRVSITMRIICKPPLSSPRSRIFDIEPTSVSIRWEEQPFASYYMAILRLLGSDDLITSLRVTRPQVTFTGLTQATAYVANVWAVDEKGTRGPRGSLFVTTGLSTPEPMLDQSSVTTSSAFFSWERTEGTKSNFYMRVEAIHNATDLISFPTSETETRVTGLSAGTRYSATLSSLSLGIRSKPSDPILFTTVPNPPDLIISRVRHNSIRLTWNRIVGAARYTVTVYDVTNNDTRVFPNRIENSFFAGNLEPSQRYEFVALTTGHSGLVSAESKLVSAFTAPSNPDDVTLVTAERNYISVRWSPQPAAQGYIALVTSNQDKQYRVEQNVSGTFFRAGNMKTGTFYKFTIYSVGLNNIFDVNVVSPLFVQTIPSPPTNLTVLDVTATSIEVMWNLAPGARMYYLTAQQSENRRPFGEEFRVGNTSHSSAVIGGLIPGEEYQFRVESIGLYGGSSDLSPSIIDSTYAAIPEPPALISVNVTLIQLQLDDAQGAVSYIVEWEPRTSDDEEPSFRRDLTTSDPKQVNLNFLQAGTEYVVTVKSMNRHGKINPVSSQPLIQQTVPAPPAPGFFSKVTSTAFAYKWPPAKGANSYNLYVLSDDFDSTFTEVYFKIINTNLTTIELYGLLSGTNYELRIQSIGNEGRVGPIGRRVQNRTLPSPAQNVRVVRVTPSIVTLEWDPVKGARRFVIISFTHVDGHSIVFETFQNRVIMTEFQAGTFYNFTIYSYDRIGRMNENGSTTIDVQTVPLPPINIGVRRPRVHSLVLVWDQQWGAISYIVQIFTEDNDVNFQGLTKRVNNSETTMFTGLDSGTRYFFVLQSIGFQEQRSIETRRVSDFTLPATPSKPELSSVSTDLISAFWDPVKGAEKYRVQIIQLAPQNNSEWEQNTTVPSIEIEGLLPGGFYDIRVFSVGRRDRLNGKGSELTTTQTIPLAPINIVFGNVTTDQINVSWNDVLGASSYVLSTREGATILDNIVTRGTSVIVGTLLPGTQYEFNVASVGQVRDRKSVTSSPAFEETNPLPPNQPSIVDITSNSISLSWNNVKGARSYVVSVTSPTLDGVREVEFSDNRGTIDKLESGSEFSFVVFSIGTRRRRTPSGSEPISTYTAPAIVTGLRTVEITNSSIQIEWDAVQGALSYTITTLPPGVETSVSSEYTTHLSSNLEPGMLYEFQVIAVGEENLRSLSHEVYMEATLPSTPDQANIVDLTTTSITLDWPDAPGAESYIITYSSEDISSTNEVTTAIKPYIFTNLVPGTHYSYSLRSVGVKDYLSSGVSPIVTQQTVIEQPPNFEVTFVSPDQINLRWDEVKGATSYNIRWRSDTDVTNSTTQTSTTLKIGSLLSGTLYQFEVRGQSEDIRTSSVPAVLDETTLPSSPTGLTDNNVGFNTIDLEWEPVKGGELYEVVVETTERTKPRINLQSSSFVQVGSLRSGGFYSFEVFAIGVGDRRNDVPSNQITVQTVPRPPRRFQFDNITTDSIGFSFSRAYGTRLNVIIVTSSDPLFEFSSQYDSQTNSTGSLRIETRITSHIVTQLQSGTRYLFELMSIGEQEGRDSGLSRPRIIETLPDTPSNPTITEVTTNSISLTWNNVRGADLYEVTVTGEGIEETTQLRTEENMINIEELRPGGIYEFQVFSVGVNEAFNFVGTEPLTIQTIPLRPSNFRITDISTNSISLAWDEVFGADNFIVTATSSDTSSGDFISSITLSSMNTTFNDLEPGTIYIFKVKSVGVQGQESQSTLEITEATLPDSSSAVRLEDSTTTTASLSWEPVKGAISYEVFLRVSGNLDGRVLTTNVPQVTATDLVAGERYNALVFSVGLKERRNEDGSNMITFQTVLSAPENLVTNEVTTSTISVGWEPVYGATFYTLNLQRIENDVIDSVEDFVTMETSFEFEDLEPGTRYSFMVRGTGDGAITTSVNSVRVFATTFPETVREIRIVEIDHDFITIEWDQASGARFYSVQIQGPEGTEVITEVTNLTMFTADLSPGLTYGFTVDSIGILSILNSNKTVQVAAQTIPLPPDNLNINDITTTTMMVEWSESTGASTYVVEYIDDVDQHLFVETVALNVALVDLISGTQYRVLVSSVSESGATKGNIELSEVTVPSTPTDVIITEVTTETVILSWQPQKGAVTYRVSVLNLDNNETQEIESENSVSVINDLEGGTWFEFVVFSVGIKSRINLIGSQPIRTQTVPSFPENVETSEVTVNSFLVTWQAVMGAANYEVIVTSSDEDVFIPDVIMTSQTNFVVTSLNSGTKYMISIVAIGDENQRSEASQTIEETTIPSTPTDVIITEVTTETVILSWQPQKGAVSYRVSVLNLDNNETQGIESENSVSVINDLEAGTWFKFVVFSVGIKLRINLIGSQPIRSQTVPSAPIGLLTSNVETISFTISWQPQMGAESYQVTVTSPDQDVNVPDLIMTSQTTLLVDNLSTGTQYDITVVAVGEEGQLSAPSQVAMETTLPSTPEEVIITEVTTMQVSLAWQPVKGAVTYRVSVFNLDNNETREVESESSVFVINNLEAGTWFKFVVFSIGIESRINLIGSQPIRTQTVPDAPLNVATANVTTTSITLLWDQVIGAESYVVRFTDDITGDDVIIPTTETSLVIGELNPGTSYDFYVIAVGQENQSSVKSVARREITRPDEISNLDVTEVETTTTNIQWQPVKGASSYRLFYKLRDIDNSPSSMVETSFTNLTLVGLEPGTWYVVVVFSVGRKGRLNDEEGSEEIQFQTVPLAPEGLRITEVTTTIINLTWSEVVGAAFYRLSYNPTENSTQIKNLETSLSSIQVVRLQPGSEYLFKVISEGDQGQISVNSEAVIDTTVPDVPYISNFTDITTTSMVLSWEHVKGATSYKLTVNEQNSTQSFEDIFVSASGVEVVGLSAGLFYEFELFSIGVSDRINEMSGGVKTQQTVPNVPTNVIANNTTTSTITLSWDKVQGALLYIIDLNSDDTNIEITNNTFMTSQTSIVISNLVSGTEYNFQVSAKGTQNLIGESTVPVYKTTIPSTPTDVIITDVTTETVSLSWQPQKGAITYRVSVLNLNNNETREIENENSVSVINNLEAGTWFQFVVFSVGIESRINLIGSQPIRTQTVPLATNEVNSFNVTTSSFIVQWIPVFGAASYEVIVTSQDSEVLVPDLIMTSQTQVLVSSLSSGTKYDITIVSVGDENQKSEESEIVEEITIPSSVSGLNVDSITNSSITLSWEASKGAQLYQVLVTGINSRTLNTSETELTVNNLEPGLKYNFTVLVVDVKGRVNMEGTGINNVQTIPLIPTGFKITSVKTTSVGVEWSAVQGALYYNLLVTSTNNDVVMDLTVYNTSTLVTSLSPGVEHRFTVKSVGEDKTLISEESQQLIQATLPEVVTNISVVNILTNQVNLEWNQPDGASSFTLQVSNLDNGITFEIQTIEPSANVTGLSAGTWYRFNVVSIGDLDVTNFEPDVFVAKQTVPHPPSLIEFTQITTEALHLTWNTVTGASSYVISIEWSVDNIVESRSLSSNLTTYDITNLLPGTEYLLTIKSIGAEGQMSRESEVVTETTRPESISGIDIADVTETTATLRWKPVKGARRYQLYYHESDSIVDDSKVIMTSSVETMVTELKPGTFYNFNVFSIGAKDRRNEEGSVQVQLQTVPSAPDMFQITEVTTTSINLSWENATGASSYQVLYTQPPNDDITILVTTATNIQVDNLERGTKYKFLVKTVGIEEGRISEESLPVSDVTVPGSPSGLTVNPVTTTSIEIGWELTQGAISYKLVISQNNQTIEELATNQTNINIIGLGPGLVYQVNLFAVGTFGRINLDEFAVLTQRTLPGIPTNFDVSDVSTNSISLEWDSVQGAVSYVISYGTDNIQLELNTTNNFIKIDGLESGTEYWFTIASITSEMFTSRSTDRITEITVPSAPTNVQTSNITTTTIQLEWNPVHGAQFYNIRITSMDNFHSNITSVEPNILLDIFAPGTTYDFYVSAVGEDLKISEESEVVTDTTRPAIPDDLRVADLGTDTTNLTWSIVKGAEKYILFIKSTDLLEPLRLESNNYHYLLTNLRPGAYYDITMTSVGFNGQVNDEISETLRFQTVSSAPDNIATNDIKPTSFQLNWDPVYGAESYQVTVTSPDEDVNIPDLTMTSQTTLLVDNLSTGTQYDITVVSVGEEGQQSVNSDVISETTIPQTTSNIDITDVESGSVTITWDPVKGAVTYRVSVLNLDNNETQEIESENSVSVINDLEAGTWFEFVVFSVGIDSRINLIGSQPIKTQTVPSQPTNLQVTETMTTTIEVTWNPVKGAQYYTITSLDENSAESSFNSTLTTYVISGLEPGSVYGVKVVAVGDENRTSEESEIVQGVTRPDYPSDVELSLVTTTTFNLSWTSIKGAEKYLIFVESSDLLETLTLESLTNQIQVSNLRSGGYYDITMTSVGVNNQVNAGRSEVLRIQTVPLPPTNLLFSEVTTDTMIISWDVAYGADHYDVTYQSAQSTTSPLVATTNLLTLTLSELTPGTWYEVKVRSVGGQGQVGEFSIPVHDSTIPLPPSSVEVVDITINEISLSWTSAFGAISYNIITNNDITNPLVTESTEIQISNLTPGETYEFQVFAVGLNMRESEGSEIIETQTVTLPPSNVEVIEIELTSISLEWDQVFGALTYIVNFIDVSTNTEVSRTIDQNSIILEFLTPGINYSITVASQSGGRVSENSVALTVLTRIGPPPTIELSGETIQSVQINWKAVPGASHYVVEVRPDVLGSSFEFQTSEIQSMARNLKSGSEYSFRVASVDTKGRQSEEWSEVAQTVTDPLPPNNLAVNEISTNSFVLSWDGVIGAVQYEVKIYQDLNLISTRNLEQMNLQLQGFEPGTLYSVEVRGVNVNEGKSDAAQIEQRTIPLPPSNIDVLEVGENFINLSWNQVNGANTYDVIVSISDEDIVTLNFSPNTALISNLEPGTVYNFNFVSVSAENLRSDKSQIVTQQTRTLAPTNLQVSPINETSVQLTWNPVFGADSYTLYITGKPDLTRKQIIVETTETINNIRSTNVVVNDLQTSVVYMFEVTAVTLDGLESRKSESVVGETHSEFPVLPESSEPLVRILNVLQTGFVATWGAINNAVAYKVVVRDGAGEVKEFTANGFNTTQVTAFGLIPDTKYNVTLKAVGSNREDTEESLVPTFITTRPVPPIAPRIVVATEVSAEFIVIQWRPSERALSYDITITEEENGNTNILRNVTSTSYNITGLEDKLFYIISVSSNGKFENSGPSISVRVQASYPVPVIPLNLVRPLVSINDVTATSFNVRVEPIEHAVSYSILVRSRGRLVRTMRDVEAGIQSQISGLEQNTLYDVTYLAVGKGGDRSRESNPAKTRTRRLIPNVPGDFQVVHVSSGSVLVTWDPAFRATGYRVSAQNVRTGLTRFYDDAVSPYNVTGLDFRETYNISVISIGRYFNSEPTPTISVTIPYPGASKVTGIRFSRISATTFFVEWTPTPFAVRYSIIVARGVVILQDIKSIATNNYRVVNLVPRTTYNVTVVAVSSDGTVVSAGDWTLVTTAQQNRFGASISPTVNPGAGLLDTVVGSFIAILEEVPDLPDSSDERLNRAGNSDLEFRLKLRDLIEQMKIAINVETTTDPGPIEKSSRKRRQTFDENSLYENLFVLAREIKLLKASRAASEDMIEDVVERLSETLTDLISNDPSVVQVISRQEMKQRLKVLLTKHLRMFILGEEGVSPVVILAGPTFTDEQVLSTFITKSSVTSTGFKVAWASYRNVHRYKITVERQFRGRNVLVFEGIRPGRSVTLDNLSPSTTYMVTVRPSSLGGDVITGIVGRTSATTLDAAATTLIGDLNSVSHNSATLSWQHFPRGIPTLVFAIRTLDGRTVQQFEATSVHSSVTFSSLDPETEYVITVTTPSGDLLFETRLTTLSVRKGKALSKKAPLETIAPPRGIRITSATTQGVTLEWDKVEIEDTPDFFVRYNVRMFRAGRKALSKFSRFVRNTELSISRLPFREYDVTVSTYDAKTRKESIQSPKLRVVLRR